MVPNIVCITNNSIKYHSLVYAQLNVQSVLFQTLQFIISHLFVLCLNVKQFSLINRQDPFRFYPSEPEWTWERW